MNINWWLLGLAFLAGVVLTYLRLVRKVVLPVPNQAAELATGNEQEDNTGIAAVSQEESSQPLEAPTQGSQPVEASAPSDADPSAASATEPVQHPWWDEFFIAHKPRPEEIAAAVLNAKQEFGAPSVAGKYVGPSGERIKGNASSMLYYTEESPWYGHTDAQEWFDTEEQAQTAGFSRWDANTKSGK